jgi:hypothetical protein
MSSSIAVESVLYVHVSPAVVDVTLRSPAVAVTSKFIPVFSPDMNAEETGISTIMHIGKIKEHAPVTKLNVVTEDILAHAFFSDSQRNKIPFSTSIGMNRNTLTMEILTAVSRLIRESSQRPQRYKNSQK